jgi:transmembrane sensor
MAARDNANMDELILRYLQGRATGEEEALLRRWREESPRNERRYREVEEVWRWFDPLAAAADAGTRPDARIIIARAEATEATEAMDAGPGQAGGEPEPVREALDAPAAAPAPAPALIGRRQIGLVAAALAALLAALGFGLGLVLGREAPPGPLEVATGAAELATVTLEDGSTIRLGPRSRLRLTEHGRDRRAWLEGRAVHRDPSRTFTVRTEYGEAVVLGTRFEVRSEDRDFDVLVVQGSVRLSVADTAVELVEGVLGRSVAGGRPSTARVEDIERLLEWMGASFVFQDTPVRRAIAEIEHRYGVRVELASSDLEHLTVSGTFTGQPVREVVDVLCAVLGAECVVGPEVIRIGARASPGTGPDRAP